LIIAQQWSVKKANGNKTMAEKTAQKTYATMAQFFRNTILVDINRTIEKKLG
jgi:hypothetical protein